MNSSSDPRTSQRHLASPDGGLSRRWVMAGAAGLSVTALAACSSGTTTSAGSAGGGSATGGTPGAASAGSGGAAGTPVAKVAEVPVGGGFIAKEAKVVVTQPTAGVFSGYSVVCPHRSCAVSSVRDKEIICPCHGSTFGLDGGVISGPATSGLMAVKVKVSGTDIVLA